MVYKLNVTDHADELLDNLVYHLIYRLKSKEAAKHLLDSVESIYDRLVENPYQFPKSRDMYLAKKGYYEAVIPLNRSALVAWDFRFFVSFSGKRLSNASGSAIVGFCSSSASLNKFNCPGTSMERFSLEEPKSFLRSRSTSSFKLSRS